MRDSVFDIRHTEEAYPPGIERNYWTFARNRIIHRQLRSSDLLGKRVLDIGCGTGVVVNHLCRLGVDCWGVEPAEDPAQMDIDGRVFRGRTASELPEDFRITIGCIMLLDVLEHMENPSDFIREIAALFPSAEHLVITLSARKELFSNYDTYYGHKTRYDMKDAIALFKGLDAEIESARYFFHMLYPPAWLMLKLGYKRGVVFSSPHGVTYWLHYLAGHLLVLDDMVLPGSLPGTSVILSTRLAIRG